MSPQDIVNALHRVSRAATLTTKEASYALEVFRLPTWEAPGWAEVAAAAQRVEAQKQEAAARARLPQTLPRAVVVRRRRWWR